MQEPQIIYEDPNFLVVNKPAGWLVHPARHLNAPCHSEKTLTDWLLKKYPEIKKVGDDPQNRPGIVHRLDKDTSGVLLVCRNQKSFNYFKKQFQEHKIIKNYLAFVHGVPQKKEGIIDKPIGLKTGTTKRTTNLKTGSFRTKMTKEATTKYKLIKVIPDGFLVISAEEPESHPHALLQVTPLTGRTHQIRVHLAFIGHPIVGDQLYGPKDSSYPMYLHAESLEFTAPSGARIKISAEPSWANIIKN